MEYLAGKHKGKISDMLRKYETEMEVGSKKYKVIKVEVERDGKKNLISYFGGLPLVRNPEPSTIVDGWVIPRTSRSELVMRLKTDRCEMCGSRGNIEVHHVRKLSDLTKKGRKSKPIWVQRMAALRRKTLIVCKKCHNAIHKGSHRKEWDIWKELPESRVR